MTHFVLADCEDGDVLTPAGNTDHYMQYAIVNMFYIV